MKSITVASTIITHIDAAHLNSAGSEKKGKSTIATVKSFSQAGRTYPYISAQALRKWMRRYIAERTQLPDYYTRIHRKISKKVSKENFIIDPINYIEDDLLGYSHPFFQNPNKDATAERLQVAAINRYAPFLISNLHPILSNYMISQDEGWIHLQRGTNLPYNTQYSTGYFENIAILNLNRIGVFQNYGDIYELDPKYLEYYYKNGELLRNNEQYHIANLTARKKTAVELYFDLILNVNGGAKGPGYAADLSPRIILSAGMQSATPIFSQLFSSGRFTRNDELYFDQSRLLTSIEKFGHLLSTDLYIGYRNGTVVDESVIYELDDQTVATKNNSITIHVTTPAKVRHLIKQLEVLS